MYRDLFSKHKERKAFITEDYKRLLVNFEFRSGAIPFNREELIEKEEIFFDGNIYLALKDNKKLYLEIALNKENLKLLYKTVIILACIFGQNIHLQYYYKDFVYYTADKYFNLNGYCPISRQLFKLFINNPTEIISKLLSLLEDKKSIFSKLIPTLSQINSISYSDIIFVSEYSLLEQLAKSYKVSGKLFMKISDEYASLVKFSKKMDGILEEYPLIKNAIKNKLDVERLNIRTNTKEKIKIFLDNFRNGCFSDYKKHVDEWNKMRQIIHGSKRTLFTSKENLILSRELHNLLLRILNKEIFDGLE